MEKEKWRANKMTKTKLQKIKEYIRQAEKIYNKLTKEEKKQFKIWFRDGTNLI